ncbi:MAG: Ca2+-binding EF-hand superfamily protein, partial [Paracoccaceae bacterium]
MKKAAYMTGLFVAAAALTATGALAFGPGGGGPMERPSFKTLDRDGDGQLTLSEIEAMGMARFAGADADGDGMLSLAELEAHAQKQAASRAASMIERFDKD